MEYGKEVHTAERFRYEDGKVLAANVNARAGVIRGHDGPELHESLLTPLMLVSGSHSTRIAVPQSLRLSHELEGLSDVDVDSSALPLITISGSRKTGDKWERLEVSVDSQRGYMPTKITRTLEIANVLRESLVTRSSILVDNVWIPSIGERTIYGVGPTDDFLSIPEDRRAALEIEFTRKLNDRHLDENSYEDRKKIGQLLKSVLGVEQLRGHALGGGKDILRAWNFRLISDTDADAVLVYPFEDGYSVRDTRTGEQFLVKNHSLVPVVTQSN